MSISDYQRKAYKNIKQHKDSKDEVLDWSIGLSEEVGEVMNCIKHTYWPENKLNTEKIVSEIGDVLWYLAALCSSLNLDLGIIARLNIEKLEHRYQTKFSKEASDNRHQLENEFKDTQVYKTLIENINIF